MSIRPLIVPAGQTRNVFRAYAFRNVTAPAGATCVVNDGQETHDLGAALRILPGAEKLAFTAPASSDLIVEYAESPGDQFDGTPVAPNPAPPGWELVQDRTFDVDVGGAGGGNDDQNGGALNFLAYKAIALYLQFLGVTGAAGGAQTTIDRAHFLVSDPTGSYWLNAEGAPWGDYFQYAGTDLNKVYLIECGNCGLDNSVGQVKRYSGMPLFARVRVMGRARDGSYAVGATAHVRARCYGLRG